MAQQDGLALGRRAIESSFERLPLGIMIFESSGESQPILYVNDGFQKLTLHSRDYAIGRDWRFLLDESANGEFLTRLHQAVADCEDAFARVDLRKADGAHVASHVMMAPLDNDEGDVSACFAVMRELKPDEGPAAGADGRPGHETSPNVMLREIQHRVKNHLGMVVSLIRMHAKRPITRKSYLALSHRIEALALLYDELLKPVADHGDGTLRAGAYLSRVASVIAGIDGRPSIRMNVEVAEIELPLDPAARLGLLLTELLTNAFHHAFEGRDRGCIKIELCRLENGRVRLSVQDDGTGLPDGSDWPFDARSLVAQRHDAETEEGELDTTSQGQSSGLGGSVVMGLTKALDAELEVSSGDRGTTVTVTLEPERKD